MNAQDVKDLIKDIPEEEFIKDIFTDDVGRCCLVGHGMRLLSDDPEDYSNDNCRDMLRNKPMNKKQRAFSQAVRCDLPKCFRKNVHAIQTFSVLVSINNNTTARLRDLYPQETVKARLMAALDDLIEAGC